MIAGAMGWAVAGAIKTVDNIIDMATVRRVNVLLLLIPALLS
jgi:hypothetical protein